MSILDRYIARQYLVNIAALLVLLFSFVVMVDVSLNLHRFLDVAGRMVDPAHDSTLRRAALTALLVADLWWPRLLQLFNFMLGLVLVGAMGFTFTQLVRHRELVAVLASGVSLRRVAAPVLVVAVALSGLQVLNQELVIPRIAPLLPRDHGDAGRWQWGTFPVMLTSDAQGRRLRAASFEPDSGRVTGLQVWECDERGIMRARITADAAEWRDGAWRLDGGVRARVEPSGLLAPPEPVADIATDLNPTALLARRFENFSHSLSSRQILAMLETPGLKPALRDRLERIGLARISTILANLLALVMALAFYLRREPVNMLTQSLRCAPVALGALLGGVIGASAPIPGLPVALAVFVPVAVLTPLAAAAVMSIRT